MTTRPDQPDTRFAHVLTTAVDRLRGRYGAIGVIAGGTLLRGEGHQHSDLDLVVCHEATWRQRLQWVIDDVPVEIFVNPEAQWRRTFEAESASGQPAMIGIFATGRELVDRDGVMTELVNDAQERFATGPRLSVEFLTAYRYRIATQFEDACDIEDVDLERSNAFVFTSLLQAVRYRFLEQGRWLPREKVLLEQFAQLDRAEAERVRAVFSAPPESRRLLAEPIIRRSIGTAHFFPWESSEQSTQP